MAGPGVVRGRQGQGREEMSRDVYSSEIVFLATGAYVVRKRTAVVANRPNNYATETGSSSLYINLHWLSS